MPDIILGINSAYHESAASLIVDGVVVAAAEEERFSRIKHAKHAAIDNAHDLPWGAIQFCLDARDLRRDEVTQIAYSLDPDARQRCFSRSSTTAESIFGSRKGEMVFEASVHKARAKLKAHMTNAEFSFVPHHEAHALSTYCCSPFEVAGILVVDGIAEDSSTWAGIGEHGSLRRLISVPDPHSIGFLWEKVSEFLGFCRYDGPGKVMALAAYGQPGADEKKFSQFIRCKADGTFEIDDEVLQYRLPGFTGLQHLFGDKASVNRDEQRRADIAYGLQRITEVLMVHVATALYAEVNKGRSNPVDGLCLAGGVALNCVANGVLRAKGPWRKLWVQPAAHDAGTALGSAIALQRHGASGVEFQNVFMGKDISDCEAETALRRHGLAFKRPKNVAGAVANLLTAGKTVAHVNGRAEFGPRALGNRSLLANPGVAGIKEILNSQIKERESFRPFAPSLLRSFSREFCSLSPEASPSGTEPYHFMTVALPVSPWIAESFPAVAHRNCSEGMSTSRVHVVEEQDNGRLREVLEEFEKLTGYPMLVNTSFNVNEPIVNSAEDACRTFSRCGIDAMALGPYVVVKEK